MYNKRPFPTNNTPVQHLPTMVHLDLVLLIMALPVAMDPLAEDFNSKALVLDLSHLHHSVVLLMLIVFMLKI